MDGLVSIGFQLMIVGMGVVFSFLVLLVVTIKLIAKLLDRYAPEQVTLSPTPNQPLKTDNRSEITAAISIAVHKYRKNQNNS